MKKPAPRAGFFILPPVVIPIPRKLTINQALYFTAISQPVLPVLQTNGRYTLTNQPFDTKSTGTDTYISLAYGELELYAGFNHTVARYSNSKKAYLQFAPRTSSDPPSPMKSKTNGVWALNQHG